MSKASMNSSRWRCTWCMGWVGPRNVDLQEYAPRICTKNMEQDCVLSMFCFPQDSNLFPPSTVMPLHQGGKHCRVRSPRGEEQAAA